MLVVVLLLSPLVLAMDHSSMEMNMTSYCSGFKSCVDCAKEGCNWCQSGMSHSFCTDVDDRIKAGCNMPGCSADSFITKLSNCYGGCGSYDNCLSCSKTPGCGWCHEGGAGIGCKESPDGSVPSKCNVFTFGTCDIPCEQRKECGKCLRGGNLQCQWCSSSKTCSAVAASGEIQSGCLLSGRDSCTSNNNNNNPISESYTPMKDQNGPKNSQAPHLGGSIVSMIALVLVVMMMF